nr:PQQ-dependent sugar dehydrogenase [Candidatus Halocynthiibacter alkanivorans]
MMRLILTILLWLSAPAWAQQETDSPIRITQMASGFDEPWAIGFLPDNALLVTERAGALWSVTPGGARFRVRGVPAVAARGQGGLLDILVPRDFATSREVFLTFSKSQGWGSGTALAVGRLSEDRRWLRDVRLLFELTPGSTGSRHFGSRLVEAADGRLFMTIGERGDRPAAQDLSRENGSVIRINRDGSVPADNPFINTQGAQPEIWSFGHRNPQGAALDLQGNLWINEHGARGGDEVNRVRKGANYGWPVISYGVHYSGAKIGEGTAKPGMQQPAFYWDPSIAPSGLMIYSGRLWPQWRGDFFIGSLKFDMISRLDGDTMQEVARIKTPQTGRVRDIREGPSGAIWFLSVDDGALYRMTPG